MKLIFVLLTSLCAQAEILDIHARFEKGQKLTLELRRVHENSRAQALNSVSTGSVLATVLEAGGDGFIVDWVPGESRVEDAELVQPVVFGSLPTPQADRRGIHGTYRLIAPGGRRRSALRYPNAHAWPGFSLASSPRHG